MLFLVKIMKVNTSTTSTYDTQEIFDYVELHMMFLEEIIVQNDIQIYVDKLQEIKLLMQNDATQDNVNKLIEWTELNNFENDYASLNRLK